MNDSRIDVGKLLDRLDRLPIWPYPKKLLIIIGIGFFFSFYDIISIGLALPEIVEQFHVSPEVASWAITSSLIGYIVGSLLDSRISDLFGRKLALYISIALFSFGSLLSATSTNIASLVFWRFIIGMGSGSEIANVSTYLSELSPAAARGKTTCWAVAAGMFGFAIVPFLALALVPNFSWGWRGLFFIGGLGGLIILSMRRHMPDSPRWLITKNRIEEAQQIIEASENYIKTHKPNVLVKPSTKKNNIGLSQPFGQALFDYRWRLGLFAVLWCVYYLGNYGWLTLTTDLFVQHGIRLGQSLLFVSTASLGFIFGSLIAVFISDRFERKYLAFFTLIIWSIALFIIAWVPKDITIMLFGFIASTTIATVIPILYTYTAENFPTAQRATFVSITDGFGHLGGAFCGQIILGVYSLFSHTLFAFSAAFSTMAITGLVTALLVLFGQKMNQKQVI